MPRRGTPALDLVRSAGVAHTVHEYMAPERHGRARDERPDYGRDAATALGVDPATIFKTLVVDVDGRLFAAVVPVDGELDLKALATTVHGRSATLADPVAAERASGSAVGGISPLAPRRPWPVVLDVSALVHPTILVSAGRRGLQVELAPTDLAGLTGATVADIRRSP